VHGGQRQDFRTGEWHIVITHNGHVLRDPDIQGRQLVDDASRREVVGRGTDASAASPPAAPTSRGLTSSAMRIRDSQGDWQFDGDGVGLKRRLLPTWYIPNLGETFKVTVGARRPYGDHPLPRQPSALRADSTLVCFHLLAPAGGQL
jgi:hypothetical protein